MIGKIVRKCVNVMTVRVSPERWVDRFSRGLLAVGGMLVSLLPVGCVDPAQRDVESIQVETDKNKENRDSLREAFRYLPQLIRLDRTAAMPDMYSIPEKTQCLSWRSHLLKFHCLKVK